ncbi:MAG: ABC transporter permease [Nitrospiraceae bacterium]|nr:MAG: ABC transporter permease [Nitrospiraceae bacterium]
MLFNIIQKSFLNQKKAVALMLVSVAAGTAVTASLLTVSYDISGKVSKELRSFGANILIEPKVEGLAGISGQKRFLREEDIVRAKAIFWRHNIIGIAPMLEATVEVKANSRTATYDIIGIWYEKSLPLPGEEKQFTAGTRTVSPWWDIKGQWPDSHEKVIAGASLSERLGIKTGDEIFMNGKRFTVSGTLETGGREDNQIIMELGALQEFMNMPGKISKVLVSALSKPMDEFAYKDPATMTQAEYEKWYCTGYITSIAKQLEEVFRGSRAKPVWNIAETEGKVLNRLTLLIYFLSFLSVLAAALGVSTTMIMSFLRRTHEIGLMKAVGADSGKIITVFISEACLTGLIGGTIGYVLSLIVSQYIGTQVFSARLEQREMLLPIALGSAVLIAVLGTILPIKKALSIKPAIILKGAE